MLTVARAVTLATTVVPFKPIVISDESFVQQLRFSGLDAGLAVLGGFHRVNGLVWRRECLGPSVFNTPTRVGLLAENSAGVTISDVYVQAAAANSTGILGDSSFGAIVSNASETFTNVTLRAGSGGDGGTPASPPPPGSAPCTVLSNTAVSMPGAPGLDGGPGALGSFTSADYVTQQAPPGTRGTDGGVGALGDPGTVLGNCAVFSSCFCASTSCLTGPRGSVQGNQGLSGCGGTGGLPGPGGGGAGASVGLLVTGASRVVLQRSLVRAGSGGHGAPGALGASGAQGSTGVDGNGQPCWDNCTGDCGNGGTRCGAGFAGGGSRTAQGGMAGGQGGTGGRGGTGGAGAGGPSYGIVTVGGAAQIFSDAGVMFDMGGAQGGNPGLRAPSAARVAF